MSYLHSSAFYAAGTNGFEGYLLQRAGYSIISENAQNIDHQ